MATTALEEVTDDTGHFVRQPSGYQHIIGSTRFPAEANRYHLYVSLACPWASGCLAMLFFKGLETAISHSVTHPTWGFTRPGSTDDKHCGWLFRSPGDPPVPNSSGYGCNACDDALIPDPVFGAATLREVYERLGDTFGKYSTPLLIDTEARAIVCNESMIILRVLNTAFNHVARHPGRDLYPEDLSTQCQSVNNLIYPDINDGVYRCGFATTQTAYEEAYFRLFTALDSCDALLARQPYLTGDRPTWVDLRLLMTLIRFDPVYFVYFKCNGRLIREYCHLSRYMCHMMKLPGIRRAIDYRHIKTHYFTSHPTLNPYGVIPCGYPGNQPKYPKMGSSRKGPNKKKCPPSWYHAGHEKLSVPTAVKTILPPTGRSQTIIK